MSILTLQQLRIPYINSVSSDIWNCEVRFEQGCYYHIKAASGQGKSSLIQTLYGLLQTYEGRILIDEKDLKKCSIEDWCHLRASKLSIVFQDLKLFIDQTAFENINIKRELTNHYPESSIHEFAQRLGVTHTLNRTIATLSYGERQRVAVIRALMQPFSLLLLDEPFSHLDEANIQAALILLKEEVAKRHATMLITDLEDDDRFPYHQKFIL